MGGQWGGQNAENTVQVGTNQAVSKALGLLRDSGEGVRLDIALGNNARDITTRRALALHPSLTLAPEPCQEEALSTARALGPTNLILRLAQHGSVPCLSQEAQASCFKLVTTSYVTECIPLSSSEFTN